MLVQGRLAEATASVADEVIWQVAEEFGETLGRPKQITPLAGPWGPNGVFQVAAGHSLFVLKRWQGADRIRRGTAETTQLVYLRQAGFTAAPAPLPYGATWWRSTDGATLWTAQEHIDAVPHRGHGGMRRHLAAQIGGVLADLHSRIDDRPVGNVSRLDELADLDFTRIPEPFNEVVASALSVVLARRDELSALPQSRVHGDVNLDNMILRRDGLVLIDWEFTRRDLRILDLATLVAPRRTPSGGFLTATPAMFGEILRGYQLAAKTPLSRRERELLPTAALAHYLLVLRDTLRLGSPHVAQVVTVVRTLLLRESDESLRR
ncbi:phosphotransferase [Micromonospora aurantiaca]|uniref:phosphotransferase enzyme family protein n=1 Tax=Micromonospora aurantiaca (nom. illeg.) TaxID=47850 RepID=UPI003455D51B